MIDKTIGGCMCFDFTATLSWLSARNRFRKLWPQLKFYPSCSTDHIKYLKAKLDEDRHICITITDCSDEIFVFVEFYRPLRELADFADLYNLVWDSKQRVDELFSPKITKWSSFPIDWEEKEDR